MATEDGAALAEECVLGWEPAIYMMLHGRADLAVPESVAYLSLTACVGKLPLCLSKDRIKCAGTYNAINAGSGLLTWGVTTGRCRAWRFTPNILALMLQGQSDKCKNLCDDLNLKTPADWQAKCAQLARVRKPCKNLDPKSMMPTFPNVEMMPKFSLLGAHGRRMTPGAMTPNLLMIHLCEWSQVKKDPAIGSRQLCTLIAKPPQKDIVAEVLHLLESEYQLRGAGAGRIGSVTQVVCTSLLEGKCTFRGHCAKPCEIEGFMDYEFTATKQQMLALEDESASQYADASAGSPAAAQSIPEAKVAPKPPNAKENVASSPLEATAKVIPPHYTTMELINYVIN